MSDKEFWELVCRGLIMVVKAIIRKYDLHISLKDQGDCQTMK